MPATSTEGVKYKTSQYLSSLYENQLTMERVISFHLSYQNLYALDQDDQSYATFGGYNKSQIVDGKLTHFPLVNTAYWSLNLGMMGYGNTVLAKWDRGKAFAVIDTGTTMIGVPDEHFNIIRAKWIKDIKKDGLFDCSDATFKMIGFCQSMAPCSNYYDQLEPVVF